MHSLTGVEQQMIDNFFVEISDGMIIDCSDITTVISK
jgi:hypothetical protein